MTVKKPEELKQVTEELFSTLSATDEMKKKILYEASAIMLEKEDGKKNSKHSFIKKLVPVICCCAILAVCSTVVISRINSGRPVQENVPDIIDIAAGNSIPGQNNGMIASTKINTENQKIISETENGFFENSLQESTEETNLLLVAADGKYYRMTKDKFPINSIVTGDEVGETGSVCSYSELVNAGDACRSTFLAEGTKLYSIDGMNGAFIAAEMNDEMIVCQRISVENRGLLNNETFTDTIPSFKHVSSIEFSDRDKITDPENITKIGEILSEYTVLEDNGAFYNGKQMILHLDNGLKYLFVLDGERIYGCGTWICPELNEFLKAY